MPETSKDKDQEKADEVLRRLLKPPLQQHLAKTSLKVGDKKKTVNKQ